MKLILILLALCYTSFTFSQEEWWKKETSSPSDSSFQSKKIKKNTKIQQKDILFSKSRVTKDSVLLAKQERKPGKVTLKINPLIQTLVEFKAATIPPYSDPVKDGFRIQLYFDHDKKVIDKMRSQMLQINKDARTYIQFQAPNYIRLLGNFRTELKAEEARSKILSEFPESIVIEDKIEFPKLMEKKKEDKEQTKEEE